LVFSSTWKVRAATVDSRTALADRIKRSTIPAEKPACQNFGVVSSGRNVDIVALEILRGK
jgi:hypothetical protein